LAPDTNGRLVKSENAYWESCLEKFPSDKFEPTLIDDSAVNSKAAMDMGFKALHVGTDMSFATALASFLGLFDTKCMRLLHQTMTSEFHFDPINYLRAKNAVDDVSFSRAILSQIGQQVYELRQSRMRAREKVKRERDLEFSRRKLQDLGFYERQQQEVSKLPNVLQFELNLPTRNATQVGATLS